MVNIYILKTVAVVVAMEVIIFAPNTDAASKTFLYKTIAPFFCARIPKKAGVQKSHKMHEPNLS
jgi:hypothetical protein